MKKNYRYIYAKKVWYLKTYMDANGSIVPEMLHSIKS